MTRPPGRPVFRARLLVIWALLAAVPAAAGKGAVPESVQLPIFFKLLTYDRTLWEDPPPSLRIGLLQRHGDPASQANVAAMVEALNASSDKTINGVPFEFTTIAWRDPADLADRIAAANVAVLYVTDGHGDRLGEIAAIAREGGLLTLAARSEYVHRTLSVGLRLDGERPRIEVNLVALAAEGHQLDARVLRLCEVVKR